MYLDKSRHPYNPSNCDIKNSKILFVLFSKQSTIAFRSLHLRNTLTTESDWENNVALISEAEILD